MTPISSTQQRNTLFMLLAAIIVVFAAIAVSQAGPAHAATPTTASITVTKAWEGGAAGSLPDAGFTTSGAGVSDFTLTEAAPSTTFAGLAPGDYSFTEAAVDGWALTGVNCSDQPAARTSLAVSHTVNVTVAAGEDLSCTFTNTKQAATTGTLTVIKMVDNSQNAEATASAADFSIHVMTADADVDGSPQAGSESGTPYTLDAGDYNVSESGGPTGYISAISGDCDATGAVTLAAGDDKTCTITNTAQSADVLGNVTITKQWVPLDGGTSNPDAEFTATGAGTAPFTLTTADPSMSLAGVSTGNYSFTEAAVDGWKLTAINCTGGSLADTIGINLSGRTLKLGVGDAEDVSCTFVNTEQAAAAAGSITIQKVWAGANGPEADFTTTGDGLTDFALTPEDDSQVFDGLNAGDYTFTEAPADGWNLTSISCTDQASSMAPKIAQIHSVTVTLAENEDVVCTFTNTPTGAPAPAGSISIEKVWADNAGGATGPDVTFTATGAGTSDFSLTNAAPTTAFNNLTAGSYTFAEAATDGWDLTSAICTDAAGDVATTGDGTTAAPLAIALTDDEAVTCVFTNTQQAAAPTGSITIDKVWTASDGGTTGPDAVFTATGTGVSDFTLSTATTSQTFPNLAAGNFTFAEAATDGWDLTSATCTDAAGDVVTTGDGSTATPLAVALADGDAVTCTFTNTQQAATTTAAINITKVWSAADGGNTGPDATFTATGDGTSGFTLTNADPSHAFTGLAAGNFSFAEAALEGWTLSSVACVDSGGDALATTGTGAAASPVAFALADAQVVNCVFTNTQQATANVSPFAFTGLFPETNTNPANTNVGDTTVNTPSSNTNVGDTTVNTPSSNAGANDPSITNGSTLDTPGNTTTNNSTSNPAANSDSSTLAPVTGGSTSTSDSTADTSAAPAQAEATPLVPSTGSGYTGSDNTSRDLALAIGGLFAISLGLASFAFTKRRD